MDSGKTDLRVKFTRDLLRKSLLELMKGKPIAEISVTDLCRAAGLNRGTFYRHYAAPFDLLCEVENELYEGIRAPVQKAVRGGAVAPVLEEIFKAIVDNGELCRILLSENGDKDFLRRIMNIARDGMVAEWRELYRAEDEATYELAYAFIASGSVAVIQDWISGGFRSSPAGMARFISAISDRGLKGLFGAGRRA